MSSSVNARGMRAIARAARSYPRKKVAATSTAALSLAGAIALFVTPAYAVLSAVSPTVDPTTALPDYYQDSTGLRITACDDGTAACAGVTKAGFAADTVGAGGIEDFFSLAVATTTGPVVTGNAAALKAIQTLAVEATHDPDGHVITFQRIRTRVQLGVPNSTYNVVEPFGTQTIATNASGVGTTTQDIGCPLGTNNPPCDFTRALGTGFAGASGSVGPFIQWDAGAPAGYIGDGVTAHTVIGSSTGNNFFSITGPGLANGSPSTSATITNPLYVVTGKISPATPPPPPPAPVVSLSPPSLAFGNQGLGTKGTAQVVTVSNIGNAPLTVSAAATSSGDFVKSADGCSGTTVAAGAHCTVSVAFAPAGTVVGARSASLTITDNATPTTQAVALSGTAVGVPGISASPSPLAFGNNSLLFGGAGVNLTLTVTSSGSAPLTITTATIAGTNAADFTVTANTCNGTTKAVGATCTYTVHFRTKGTGARSGTLSIASNVATSPTVVSLTGNGTF